MTFSIEGALIDLLKAYSPTGHEHSASEIFQRYLAEIGVVKIRKDGVGNVRGIFPGRGIKVLLCGHIDTVPGKLQVRKKEGKIYGRGAVDAKSSLISFLFGSRLAKQRGFSGTIEIAATVGEEGSGKGISKLVSSGTRADYVIFGEPSNTYEITVGYRGRLLIEGRVQGKSHHASAPWLGKSAIDTAMESLQAIKEAFGTNREFSKVSASSTSIRAGNADNVTPSTASFTIDVRFPPSKNRTQLFQEVLSLLTNGGSENAVKVTLKSYADPYVADLRSPLVSAFSEAIARKGGQRASLIFKSGSGDMNILGPAWGVPVITYGPGNPRMSHSGEEWVLIDDVVASSEIVADALFELEARNAKNFAGDSDQDLRDRIVHSRGA